MGGWKLILTRELSLEKESKQLKDIILGKN